LGCCKNDPIKSPTLVPVTITGSANGTSADADNAKADSANNPPAAAASTPVAAPIVAAAGPSLAAAAAADVWPKTLTAFAIDHAVPPTVAVAPEPNSPYFVAP